MRTLCLIGVVACLIGCSGASQDSGSNSPTGSDSSRKVDPKFEGTSFEADDGVTVWADFSAVEAGKDAPVVLLFHQATSNAKEYEPIAPLLNDLGMNTLSVDLRCGGPMFQGQNRTAAAFKAVPNYLSAYRDMQAAVQWAIDEGYEKIILIGSSYSASLVLRLAAENKGIAEVVAFSPGEYFEEDGVVAKWASKVTVPVYIACAPDEEADTEKIFDAIKHEDKSFFAPKDGAHGASMLRSDRNKSGSAAAWDSLKDFLGLLEEEPPADEPG